MLLPCSLLLLVGGVCCVVFWVWFCLCCCVGRVGCCLVSSVGVLVPVAVCCCFVVVAVAGGSSVVASRSCSWLFCLVAGRFCFSARWFLALAWGVLACSVCSRCWRWWSSAVCLGLSRSAGSLGSRLRLACLLSSGGGLFFCGRGNLRGKKILRGIIIAARR